MYKNIINNSQKYINNYTEKKSVSFISYQGESYLY